MAAAVPFAVSSPTTLKGKLLMRIVCPIGSVGPNRFFLTVSPITATFAAIFTSDRKSTRLNSSHGSISYAVFCLKKKKKKITNITKHKRYNNISNYLKSIYTQKQ